MLRIALHLTVAAAVLLLAAPARAGDIGETLAWISDEVNEDLLTGLSPELQAELDKYIASNPNEALSILLFNRSQSSAPVPQEERPFETLGTKRLSYQELAPLMAAASKETGLPVSLIDAVIRTESGYRPEAVSRTGAQGLMQLMPATAREVGVRNAFDPRQNILGGARYLRKMYDRFGSVKLAVAAYNAGPGAVIKHGGVPPFRETLQYVRTVLARYQTSRLGGISEATER